jgi:RsiW-degrading membrane proteinase PrsW (M82 family)
MVQPGYEFPNHAPRPGLPDPERGRRMVGIALYVAGMLAGAALLFLLFFVLPFSAGVGPRTLLAMAAGALLAFPAACVYLVVPRTLDRYDPEPAYALAMALGWGAIAACGFSALVNSLVGEVVGALAGEDAGHWVSTVVSAPIVEEASKGILVLGFFYFLRREFDGIVDGIIYATFVAIGFAAVENVVYYAQAGLDPDGLGIGGTFCMRGLLTPWGHPLYTSMTGMGVGLARESTRPWVRRLAPVGGYTFAVLLHALWNGSAVLLGGLGAPGAAAFLAMLVLWFVFVAAFLAIVFALVLRRGRIIREHLLDEVALGHLTHAELEIAASAFGRLRAYFRRGALGVEFVRAVARLALSKWHAARAWRSNRHTVSTDLVAPLRRRIRELRAQGGSPG